MILALSPLFKGQKLLCIRIDKDCFILKVDNCIVGTFGRHTLVFKVERLPASICTGVEAGGPSVLGDLLEGQ